MNPKVILFAIVWTVFLFLFVIIRAIYRRRGAIVDVNLKCPGCGHRSGKLRCIVGRVENAEEKGFIEHTCLVCGATFYEETVVDLKLWRTKPPLPPGKG